MNQDHLGGRKTEMLGKTFWTMFEREILLRKCGSNECSVNIRRRVGAWWGFEWLPRCGTWGLSKQKMVKTMEGESTYHGNQRNPQKGQAENFERYCREQGEGENVK